MIIVHPLNLYISVVVIIIVGLVDLDGLSASMKHLEILDGFCFFICGLIAFKIWLVPPFYFLNERPILVVNLLVFISGRVLNPQPLPPPFSLQPPSQPYNSWRIVLSDTILLRSGGTVNVRRKHCNWRGSDF